MPDTTPQSRKAIPDEALKGRSIASQGADTRSLSRSAITAARRQQIAREAEEAAKAALKAAKAAVDAKGHTMGWLRVTHREQSVPVSSPQPSRRMR